MALSYTVYKCVDHMVEFILACCGPFRVINIVSQHSRTFVVKLSITIITIQRTSITYEYNMHVGI